jgi:hypothetical protein
MLIRDVKTAQQGNGSACVFPLSETVTCNTQPCPEKEPELRVTNGDFEIHLGSEHTVRGEEASGIAFYSLRLRPSARQPASRCLALLIALRGTLDAPASHLQYQIVYLQFRVVKEDDDVDVLAELARVGEDSAVSEWWTGRDLSAIRSAQRRKM